MHIDIEINFNDLTPPNKIGMVPKKKSYYDQLTCLVKSIKLNWDRNIHDYTIYVHHSRDLHEDKKNGLEELGCNIVFNPSELQEFFNRENILSHETHGDYTMILDTDMLVLNTPVLEFDHEVYAKPAGNNGVFKRHEWEDFYSRMDLELERNFIPHFNGGCWFIKNECKKPFYDLYLQYLDVLRYLETRQRHFSMQYYYSAIVKKFDWGVLHKKINVYSYETLDADILHYLGVRGYTDGVQRLINKVESDFEALLKVDDK
jgi:hypothetical protein